MTSLKDLHLNSTQVTDAGLEHLKELAGFRHLYLFSTQVTDAGRAKIKAALPDLNMYGGVRGS